MKSEERIVVIACSIMKNELEEVVSNKPGIEIRYLEQALHRTPLLMPSRIQNEIDAVSEYAGRIVLGYGLCSNGIVGVIARRQPLLIPRCHDCITLLLGSRTAYAELFDRIPGTYYLTPGWIEEKKDPLSIVEDDYAPRVGYESAVWVMQEELKHYTHIALISSGLIDIGPFRERALKNAAFFEKEYLELSANLDFFRKMAGIVEAGADDFVTIAPGAEVTQEMFLDY